MDLQELDQLIDLFLRKDILELEVEEEGRRVRLKRSSAAPPPALQQAADADTSTPASKTTAAEADSHYQSVDSPMVGTFYRAPAPGARPFVEEGQSINKGATLCILEAMKVMNEIESEFRARIVSVLIEDGQPVEFGEPMFLVEPL